ncbi:FAD-binding and (Fe-S)-binding domain-containing protein [Sphaerisporangium sp. NPDC051011]|uniref:FAD-binding and (Fe-S)-binding domain-containing protein n=1 Tax=Sphaerisporangium sp. NPDC051011 TaxID=3155792 RepID=UPI0033F8A6C2
MSGLTQEYDAYRRFEPRQSSTQSAARRADLAEALRGAGLDADTTPLTRSLYSSDAGLYRVLPQAVVKARHADDLIAAHDVARRLRLPITMRGAGTSISGNAVGEGIVIDTRRFNRILDIDPVARTAHVQPGVVHADLQRAAAPHGLRFGPDPSSHSRCTIGGMIGNNACGSRALGYGRTVDNVESMSVLYGNGESATVGPGSPAGATAARLAAVGDANLRHLRTEFGRFGRQVSGYGLEHLLPERRRIDRFLVGSEGSLALVLDATVRLVDNSDERKMLVLGYPSMVEAADAVPALLAAVPGRLIACEGMDARIVDLVRAKGSPVPDLPRGSGWLFAEVTGDDAPDLIRTLIAAAGALDTRLVEDTGEAAALWRIREDGAGLAGRSLPTPAYGGWEDAAVPPENLGAWLRDFEALLEAHGLQGIPYGHFGDGCVHCRINFPFQPGDPGSSDAFREFMTACATRLRDYRGTLSGEHGDGRVRSELLPLMYDETSLALFKQVKAVCDPENILNPGIIADPAPITDDLRAVRPRTTPKAGLRLVHDQGDLGAAVHRCTGVGKCVAPKTAGVICPSYLATRDERDSTRGRSRVLQEALDGELINGLTDPAVGDALDLCLACKGCSTDCPSGVDMATYKSEVLHQRHDIAGLRRPRSHIFLGRLPRWARLGAPFASLTSRLMRFPRVSRLAKWLAGIDARRSVPAFASPTLRKSKSLLRGGDSPADVWIWADSFTDHFFPRSGLAAIRFLEAHGLAVRVISQDACCGLTWITTGQLDEAKKIVAKTIRALAPYVSSGVPVIALEPSCLATLRSDALELSADPDAEVVAGGVLSFAELVDRLNLPLPDLTGIDVVAQPHCHQNAVIGWGTDQMLLERAGATVTKVPGCCGLAGNFGVERGHYDVSVAVAETHLLPAVRSKPDAVFLADGMSCRVQLDDLAGVPTLHIAELLASRI